MRPVNTFPSVGLLRNPRIEALKPMTSMAQTNSSPLRRWMVPPFFTTRATAPRTMASPPAAMWIGRSRCMVGPPDSVLREDFVFGRHYGEDCGEALLNGG